MRSVQHPTGVLITVLPEPSHHETTCTSSGSSGNLVGLVQACGRHRSSCRSSRGRLGRCHRTCCAASRWGVFKPNVASGCVRSMLPLTPVVTVRVAGGVRACYTVGEGALGCCCGWRLPEHRRLFGGSALWLWVLPEAALGCITPCQPWGWPQRLMRTAAYEHAAEPQFASACLRPVLASLLHGKCVF